MAVSPDDVAITRRKRINCSNCGYRIPADAIRCPHCRQDPHQFRLKWTTVLLLIVSGVLFIYLCFLLARILFGAQFAAALVEPTATHIRPPH
jgi:RNA polymerase subunit RPABC4/transcription elongation factor Spt4